MIPHLKRFATPAWHPCPLSIRNRPSLALLIFITLLFHTRPPWPRQPRACVNGARYDIISPLGRSVTLVTFHSVDASEIAKEAVRSSSFSGDLARATVRRDARSALGASRGEITRGCRRGSTWWQRW